MMPLDGVGAKKAGAALDGHKAAKVAVARLDGKDKKFLLSLARRAVGHYLKTGRKLDVKPSEVPSARLVEDGACFVTLYIGKALRGCIGSLEARRPLVMDVVDNALAAAFGDPRFYPLSEGELPKVKFTISVLTPPVPFAVKDAGDLLERLVPGRHGMVIEKGRARATFLPAVWEHLPDKRQFLGELCMKAGLGAEEWRDTGSMRFFVYESLEFSE